MRTHLTTSLLKKTSIHSILFTLLSILLFTACEQAIPWSTELQQVGAKDVQWQDSFWLNPANHAWSESFPSDSWTGDGYWALVDSLYLNALIQKNARAIDPLERWAYTQPGQFANWADYLYAWEADTLKLHSYAAHLLETKAPMGQLKIKVSGSYPFEEEVFIHIYPSKADTFSLWLRIPGWAAFNEPDASGQFRYAHFSNRKIKLSINGEYTWPPLENGYAKVRRFWQAGDSIELLLPLSLRQVESPTLHPGQKSWAKGPVLYRYPKNQEDAPIPLWKSYDPMLIWGMRGGKQDGRSGTGNLE